MKISISILIITVCFFSAIPGFSQTSDTLSSTGQISLLTSTPGPLLYQAFGHSALRVRDKSQNLDEVYNYGTFDFNTENFYWKFVKGYLNYSLEVRSFEKYLEDYHYYNQSVYEQVFNFTNKEANEVYKFLQNNQLPENKFYLYDYFHDNCANRIGDLIFTVFAEQVEIDNISWYEAVSFRESIDPYLRDKPWIHLGIDLSLGLPVDRIMQPKDYFFLPEYLMLAMQNSILDEPGYGTKPLVKSHQVLHAGREFPVDPPVSWSSFSLLVLLLMVVLLFTAKEVKKSTYYKKIDLILFGILGIIGLYLLFLWLVTAHEATYPNADLLWASPLHLLAVYFITIGKTKSQFFYWYFSIMFLLLLLYLMVWIIDFKNFNWLLIPVLSIYFIRLTRWNFYKKGL